MHIKSLTGLRFIAVLFVFLYHIQGVFSIPNLHLPFGNNAVAFFFVLSGFILTYVYSKKLKTRADVAKFYKNRVARIWPLHFVCLMLFVFFVFGWNYSLSTVENQGQLLTQVFLVQSLVPNAKWIFSQNPVAWSISTEMLFYLLFPLLVMCTQKSFWRRYVFIALATPLALFGLQYFHTHFLEPADGLGFIELTSVVHVNPLLRFFEFATGAAVGHLFVKSFNPAATRNMWKDTALEFSSIGMLVGYWFLILKYDVYVAFKTHPWLGDVFSSWLWFSSPVLIFAYMIWIFARSQGLIAKVTSTKTMVFLGEISFAFYLIHMFVIRILSANRAMDPELFTGWPAVLFVFVVSIAASTLLFKLVEMPGKKLMLKILNYQYRPMLSATGRLVVARPILIPLATLVICFVVSQYLNYSAYSQRRVQQVIAHTPPEYRDIRFGELAILKGTEIEPNENGVRLRLAWEAGVNFGRTRFIHLCDAQGRIIANITRTNFDKHQSRGDVFLDVVDLTWDEIENSNSVGVGFWDKELGMPHIDRGPRAMKNHRLVLAQFGSDSILPNGNERVRLAREIETTQRY